MSCSPANCLTSCGMKIIHSILTDRWDCVFSGARVYPYPLLFLVSTHCFGVSVVVRSMIPTLVRFGLFLNGAVLLELGPVLYGVPGSWFLVPGSWFLVPGSWFLVPGSWVWQKIRATAFDAVAGDLWARGRVKDIGSSRVQDA